MHREQSLRMLVDRPPFGYRPVPVEGGWALEVDPRQAAVVREITQRLVAGEFLTTIAADLNERAIPTPYDWNRQRTGRDPRGGRWSADTLRAVLGPHLDGRYVVDADGQPITRAPAILDPVTYADLEAELNRRKAAPLHGIVRCGCGAWVQLRVGPGRPPQQGDYRCPQEGHLAIPAWWLEGDVTTVALATLGESLHEPTGQTFEHAWYAAQAEDKAAGSWTRRRALLRAAGVTLRVEEDTGDEGTRQHGRLGLYRYSVDRAGPTPPPEE